MALAAVNTGWSWEADARRREPAESSLAQGRMVNSELTIFPLGSQLPLPALPAQRLGAERSSLRARTVGQAQEAAASPVKKAVLTDKAFQG